jgi:aspartate-semialdehyde dehydrogenase
MADSRLRIAISNPLTLVGKELQSILNMRGIPYAHMELIDTTGVEEEKLTATEEGAAVVRRASDDSFLGADVVFFCGSAESNEPYIERAIDDGAFVIDLSQPSSIEGARAVVVGVNEHSIEEKQVAVSPHPVTIPIALITAQLQRAGKLRLCAVSVVQPASEYGQAGVDELFQQTISALNLKSMPSEVFDRQLAFNLYPAVGGDESEMYVSEQLRQIMMTNFPLALSITQGTIFHGHSFSFFAEFEEPIDVDAIRAQLDRSEAIEVAAIDETIATLDAAGRDEILIGRVHGNKDVPNGVWIWAVADNLRRSSALNAVLIAEEYLARFGDKPN